MKYCNLAIGSLLILIFVSSCSSHYKESGQTSKVSQASFNDPKRLLLLTGETGTVACRVYGNLISGTIPKLSNNKNLECATRSLLRMKNLTAVRGVPGASMIGPVDYLGNLEEPHKYLYIIQNGFPPVFHRSPVPAEKHELTYKEFDNSLITAIKAYWISGRDRESIKEKKVEYNVVKKHLKQSLFLKPGLLEVDREIIQLNYFDPREIDLSSFKARLVENKNPFQITNKPLPSKDDYRLVTYLYEPLYAEWQTQNGSGLFLEKHRFSQTITPVLPDSKGFVALARVNDDSEELEIIGVHIPYGYTLIIDEGCIHGDSTLNGLFMMGMTSNHTTMRTADTVFLKVQKTKKNAGMVMIETEKEEQECSDHFSSAIAPPYVIYKEATESDREKFRFLTKEYNFIFNPFSRVFWQK